MVGLTGFEPVTSSMSTRHSNQLSYNPNAEHFCSIAKKRASVKRFEQICEKIFMWQENSPFMYNKYNENIM